MTEHMDATNVQFAQDVKAARLRLGWSQDRLAEEANRAGTSGVNQITVSRIEAGTHAPRLGQAVAIATALGFEIAGIANDDQIALLRRRQERIKAIIDGQDDGDA